MTTNSPNPVDGDVQALIADCKSEIKHLEGRIEYCNKYGVGLSDYESQLKRQHVALAALTAKPVVEVNTWWPLGVDGGEQPFLQPLGNLPAKGSKLYTAPPAQPLRPVELPERATSEMFGGLSLAKAYGWNAAINKCAELLRQQGYEVKS